jgi:hypothetical protein
VETKNFFHQIPQTRLPRRGAGHLFSCLPVFASLPLLVFLSGCDRQDVSLQAELASLREKIRLSEADRDLAVKDKAAAEQEAARSSLLAVAALKESLGKAMKSFEQNAAAAFPGYRPSPGKAGRIFYVYEAAEPYRASLELVLVPISDSALTPELPKVLVEARAGVDGVWQMPSQAALRELQAAAVARNTGDRRPQQEPAPPKSRTQQPSAQPAQQPGGSARVIDWGDSQGSGETRKPEPPAQRSSQPSGNTPRAAESYEIRFND